MARSHLGALQAALPGLLALRLGFNFAMATSRFDARTTLMQEGVNAINTAYLGRSPCHRHSGGNARQLRPGNVTADRARRFVMQALLNTAPVTAQTVLNGQPLALP